jgi:hypothetical protein
MIRTTQQNNPTRRIAVIQIPRPQRARMGSIGPGSAAPVLAWTTIEDAAPDSSANWLSYKLMEQARARETTPGTLSYTPASDTPDPNVAPWNSWRSPDVAATAQDLAAPPLPDHSTVWLMIGILVATASATYLLNTATSGRR